MISTTAALERLRAAASGRAGTWWVGIDGLGASGKTSFAGQVAAALPGAVVVHVDDFARQGVVRWEQQRFVDQVLEPLLAGRPARYECWDVDLDVSRGWAEVPPGVPVVVEGVSATDSAVPVPWALAVWVEAPEDVRRARVLARDPAERLDLWRTDWWPQEQAYLAEQDPAARADLVVAGW